MGLPPSLPPLPWSDSLFPPQRSVVQATPQAPKASPVQPLTVQGLQPVHVAQEVRISPTYLWANWGWSWAGLGRGAGPRPKGGNGTTSGVLSGLASHWAPPLAVGSPFSGTWHFRAKVLLRE